MVDGSYLTAMVGLAGAAIGGLTSFATSWLTQRTQMREKMRAAALSRREQLYTDFITEASRLFGDALGHEREDISDLVTLYALVARMRLVPSPTVLASAEDVVRDHRDLHRSEQNAPRASVVRARWRFRTAAGLQRGLPDRDDVVGSVVNWIRHSCESEIPCCLSAAASDPSCELDRGIKNQCHRGRGRQESVAPEAIVADSTGRQDCCVGFTLNARCAAIF